MSWTDERVELLKKLWAEGLSASQIAGELGGVTRNAVIGKVHRLGLSGRAKSTSSTPRVRKTRTTTAQANGASKSKRPNTTGPASAGNTALKMEPTAEAKPDVEAKPSPAPVAELSAPQSNRATILTLTEHMCKWPVGDPTDSDFHFCGARSETDSPYCSYHSQIAYQPVSDRRRERKVANG